MTSDLTQHETRAASQGLQTDLSRLGDAVQTFSRLGEHWVQGPVGAPHDVPVTLSEYIARVRDVERAIGERGELHRRLRRIRYSAHVLAGGDRSRGRRMDDLLAGRQREVPLTWGPGEASIPVSSLDGLARAQLVLPREAQPAVDPARVAAGIEAAFQGSSAFGVAAETFTDVPVDGLVTWVGDLAAWFVEWYRRRLEAEVASTVWTEAESEAALLAVQKIEAPIEAILADADAQVLAASYQALFSGDESLLPAPADRLDEYYTSERQAPPTVEEPRVDDRFLLFVRHAVPAIPNTEAAGVVTLAPEAGVAIKAYVDRAATLFFYHGAPRRWFSLPNLTAKAAAEEVVSCSATISSIVARFERLLKALLSGGALPNDWPRAAA